MMGEVLGFLRVLLTSGQNHSGVVSYLADGDMRSICFQNGNSVPIALCFTLYSRLTAHLL